MNYHARSLALIGYSSTMILLGAAAAGNFLLIKGKEASQSAGPRSFIDFPLMFNSVWSNYNTLMFYLFHMKPTLQTHSIAPNWGSAGSRRWRRAGKQNLHAGHVQTEFS